MASPTLSTPSPRGALGPESPLPAQERLPAAAGPQHRALTALLRRILPALELALAAVAVCGTATLVPTLLFGRTAPFWPSLSWLGVAGGTFLLALASWVLAARAAQRQGWKRYHIAAWPLLALLPPALAALALYRDDASNHITATYLPAKQSLLAYTAIVFVAGQVVYWLALLVPRFARSAASLRSESRDPGLRGAAPILLAVAGAIYLNASLFMQFIPRQTDLLVNLRGARDLLAGALPYHDVIPVWADRVHLLPVTLLLLFGPLTLVPEDSARLIFFLTNQVLWLGAMWLLARHLAPPAQRPLWLAGMLVFGATFWPWQEAIRFGQQDGLLILLFVASILAAARGREGLAGVALGLALVVKPLSIWLPLVYLVHGRWRTLIVAGATGAAVAAATLPFTGWEPWLHFVRVELPAMLPGTVRGTNIPLPSQHARMFVGREALGDGEPAPTLAVIGALNTATNLLGLLVVARLAAGVPSSKFAVPGSRSTRNPELGTRDWLLDASIGLALTLLLAPMAWQHYASWLCIAYFVLALPQVWGPLSRGARVATGTLAGAGFLLLSLEDGRLLQLMTPIVERWPGALAFYCVGLLCLTGSLLVARWAGSPAGLREA